jgi:hypothetical protein
MFRGFALHREIGVGQSAGVRISEPAPDQDAAYGRTIENCEPVGLHLGLQRRIRSDYAFLRALPRFRGGALCGSQADFADDD